MSRPEPVLGNPQNTIAVLNQYHFVFQKKYGQNFLIAMCWRRLSGPHRLARRIL